MAVSERIPLPVPPELQRLSTLIDSHIECLAGPSSEFRSTALHAAKNIFDWAIETERSSKPHLGTLLTTLAEAAPPQTRSQTRHTARAQKSRKKVDTRETPLASLFIEGMNIDQIWQQLDLRAARVCDNLQTLLGEDEDGNAGLDGEDNDNDGSIDEDEDEDEDEDDSEEMDIDDNEGIWEKLSDEEEEDSSAAEDVVDLRNKVSDDEDHGPPTSILDVGYGQKRTPSRSYSDLDDGFFDLAIFNAETSEGGIKKVHRKKLNSVAEEDSTEESEMDLFSAVDDLVAEDVDDDHAPTEFFYSDFFEPPGMQNKDIRPPKVRFHDRVSVKKIKAVGRGMPVSSMDDEESEDSDEDD